MKQKQNIDDFSKYLIKHAGLEVPSSNFVTNVISTINVAQNKSSVTVYKPLISKVGWFCIAFSLVGLFIFFYVTNTESALQFPSIDINFFNKLRVISIFEKLKLSKIFTFSFMLFSVLVLFQLYFIKKYFNKNTSI